MKQRKILIFCITVVAFAWPTLGQALSCAPPQVLIGVVKEVESPESHPPFMKIQLDNFFTFELSDLAQDSVLSLDRYERLVQEYLNGSSNFFKPPLFGDAAKGLIFVAEPQSLASGTWSVGDILVHGPPAWVCRHGFYGVFSPSGKLKTVVMRGGYEDWSYQGYHLSVEPGKALNCSIKDKTCTVKTKFVVGEENFILSPGETAHPKSGPITSISLENSKHYNGRINETYDWGFGSFTHYVLSLEERDESVTTVPPEKIGLLRALLRTLFFWR